MHMSKLNAEAALANPSFSLTSHVRHEPTNPTPHPSHPPLTPSIPVSRSIWLIGCEKYSRIASTTGLRFTYSKRYTPQCCRLRSAVLLAKHGMNHIAHTYTHTHPSTHVHTTTSRVFLYHCLPQHLLQHCRVQSCCCVLHHLRQHVVTHTLHCHQLATEVLHSTGQPPLSTEPLLTHGFPLCTTLIHQGAPIGPSEKEGREGRGEGRVLVLVCYYYY